MVEDTTGECTARRPTATPASRRGVTGAATVSLVRFLSGVPAMAGRASALHRNKTTTAFTGAWVQDQKVTVANGDVSEYRVSMKVSFVLED